MSGPYGYGSPQPVEFLCPNCGRANEQGTNFCRGCGSPLAPPLMPGMPPPQQPQQAQSYQGTYSQPPPAPSYYPPEQPLQPPPGVQPQYANYAYPYPPQPVMVVSRPRKSASVAFLLALIFGPLGLFYATVIGGIVMVLAAAGAWALFFGLVVNRMDYYAPLATDSGVPWVTLLALGIWVAIVVASVAWALAAVNAHNNRLPNSATG